MADAEPPLARGVRWLSTIRATLAFCLLLCLVFAVELYVWHFVGFAPFVRLFVARQRPSVGWLLAPLAHAPEQWTHLVSNVGQLLVFGGIAERRLRRERYVVFLAVSGLATTAAQVTSYAVVGAAARGFGTFGASGIALALAALVVVDSSRFRLATGRWYGEVTWVWALMGAFVVSRAFLDLFVAGSEVGVVGHLTGVLIGLSYGLVRSSTAVVRPTEWTVER